MHARTLRPGLRLSRLLAALTLSVSGAIVVVAVTPGIAGAADLQVASISAGGSATCAVTTDGAAKCWGWNQDGELGDGTNIDQVVPADVVGLGSGVASISVGADHTCAVTVGGAAKCWGLGDLGALGDGAATSSSSPVAVSGLGAGVAAVVAGADQSCALTTGGAVKCWGDNAFGELGDGTTTQSNVPVDVVGLGSGVAQIGAGDGYTCARTTLGMVECWGYNAFGQLGDGTTTQANVPVDVVGLAGVTALAVGESHACTLTPAGRAKCWGRNDFGQLGDGTTTDAPAPVDVAGLRSGVTAVSAGGDHTCAIVDGGAVVCWGHNNWGQLGDGPGGNSTTPTAVAGLGFGTTALSSGELHNCALAADGAAVCWGIDFNGELGRGTASQLSTPTPVDGLFGGVTEVTAGYHHTCVIAQDFTLLCWGQNDRGQIGDGTTLDRSRPEVVAGPASHITEVAAGYDHTCALSAAGAVECWGDNDHGQLGDGTTTQRNAPVPVVGLGSHVVGIAAGVYHTCALTSGGAVKCWGDNSSGALGDGSTTNRHTPVAVTGLGSGILGLSAGADHTCAVTPASGVVCWGDNAGGDLGDGTTTPSAVPLPVATLGSGVASVSTGGTESCALTNAGGVTCWGDDGQGMTSLVPAAVAGLGSGVQSIDVGAVHICALLTGGAMQCFGYGQNGELGSGPGQTNNNDSPTGVFGLGSGVDAMTAEGDHTCAVLTTSVNCWGSNERGQLGDGSTGYSTVPVGVAGLGLRGSVTSSAPSGLSVAPAASAANASWTAPNFNGGAPVYGYLVTVTSASGDPPSGLVGPSARIVNFPLALAKPAALIGGLSNGGVYRLDIAPLNRAGIGGSILSSVVTPHPTPPVPPTPPPVGGYWMVGATGAVYAFGNASYLGNATAFPVSRIESTPTHRGYWVVDAQGDVSAFGDASRLPGAGPLPSGEYVTGLSSTRTGRGYWLFTNRGRVLVRGDAVFFGDLHATVLNGSVVGSVATSTGRGYYMVGSDGGVFAFGDARFHGSMGRTRLNRPVTALVPTADNRGYWLVAADGGIFSFDAPFRGSMGATPLNRPVIGMVRYGNGYLMIGSDGGVFDFSNLPFAGSLGEHAPYAPIVSLAASS